MKTHKLFKVLFFVFIIVCCVGIDFFSKRFFAHYFATSLLEKIIVLPFLDFVLVANKGVSFSFLYNLNHVLLSFIIIIALIAMTFYVVKKFKNFSILEYYTYAFILGGGFGNIISRVVHGFVVDFISMHFFGFYFPVFNFADVFISIAMFMFLYDNFIVKGRER